MNIKNMRFLKRLFYKIIKKSPASMEMVSYWKTGEGVCAKLTKSKEGNTIMFMEGEKYSFNSYPRGYLLFGKLSKLKHEIKNQIFNESWYALEDGKNRKEVIKDIVLKLFGNIAKLSEETKYDRVPFDKMSPPIREIYRAWTKVAPEVTYTLRDYLCFILNEDDAYKFRVQWLTTWFGWFLKINPVKHFDYALRMLEHGEVVSDMKERQRLLRRILMLVLEDEIIRGLFIKLFKEINWNKVKLTKADKYFFRGKYFKVDLDLFDY